MIKDHGRAQGDADHLHYFREFLHSTMLLSNALSLHPIKYYWSFSHQWHNFLMSMIKAKTQTRFMVLFTSRSSLTWGNLQALCLVSPPGIYTLSTLNNWLLMSLQRLHDDRICILHRKGKKVGEGYDVSMGKSQHLPLPELPGNPMSFLWGTTFHQQPKNLGGHPGTPQWHGLSPSLHRRHFRGSEL